jgi:splicing factor 3B subunit 2
LPNQVPAPATQKSSHDGIEVALNPDELDLDTAAMQAKYEQQVREQQSQLEKEDLSDMVADHAAKQAKVQSFFSRYVRLIFNMSMNAYFKPPFS